MVYPRLYLARNLLREDGVIFVSIDDHEVDNLKKICNEVFGEENNIENFIWKKSYGGGAKEHFAVKQHEYCLLYAKNAEALEDFWLPPDPGAEEKYYDGRDELYDTRGPYRIKPLEATKSMDRRENLIFSIPAPDGTEIWPKRQWWWSRERIEKTRRENGLVFTKTKDSWSVSYKQYLISDDGQKRGIKPFSVIDKIFTQHGTADLRALFGDEVIIQFPKPVALMTYFMHFGSERDSIILDFFAGSGTTAQAVLELNKGDIGNRKFILVQLPEPTGREDYPTIAEITKERVRQVIQKLNKEDEGKLPLGGEQTQDSGFRVFKLTESNFKTWNANTSTGDVAALQQQLELHIDHIRDDRTAEDILYEILLKSGFPLTTPVEQLTLAGKTVYSAVDGALFICLERQLTLDLIRAMAEHRPERVVCLDNSFTGNDQLKANAVQLFKNKGVTSFKTV